MKYDIDAPVIKDVFDSTHWVIRDGFVFTSFGEPHNVYNAIVLRNPSTAYAASPCFPFSERSLEDHIQIINQWNIKKAFVFAESLDFLLSCPSLQELNIIPSNNATPDVFDYSVLNKMPQLIRLSCATEPSDFTSFTFPIDYSSMQNLEHLFVCDSNHKNYWTLHNLKYLHISGNVDYPDVSFLQDPSHIENFGIWFCKMRSLKGLHAFKRLNNLSLEYNRSLQSIEQISLCANTLEHLRIHNCPKIEDFSFLAELRNLKSLWLEGKNSIPSLSFLQNMPNLQKLIIKMNVLDGDLSLCQRIPYVVCQNKRHYNLKNEDLPKLKPAL